MNSVQDKTFMFTGRLSITRSKAQDLVREVGGNAGSALTRNTDFLIVGEDPGSKLVRAGIMGIPQLYEEEFFSMLEEARKDSPDYEESLTPEENRILDALIVKCQCRNCGLKYSAWAKEDICPLCESNPNWNVRIEPELDLPPEEFLSYNNFGNLTELINSHPEALVYPGTVCPICDFSIYYSTIGPTSWYCFNCHFYVSRTEHTWVAAPVRDVGDLYTLTREILVLGYPIIEVDMGEIVMDDGKYFTNNRGKLLFVGNAELDKNRKTYRIRNFCNSLESLINILEYLKAQPTNSWKSLEGLTSEEVDGRLEAFENLYKRRYERSLRTKGR